MAAVSGAPALPSLSRIVNWDTTHLETAAREWTSTAEGWEDTFAAAHRGAMAPGGTDWDGAAAEATQQRTLADLVKVRGLADTLHTAGTVARSGASEIDFAKQQALNSIRRAEEAGFDVHDDLSLSSRRGFTPAEYPAKLAEGQALSAEINARALELAAVDAEVAGKLTAAVAPLGEVSFPEAPMPTPPPRDNTVQLVDNKTSTDTDDGTGDSGGKSWKDLVLPPELRDQPATDKPPPTLQDALFPPGTSTDPAKQPKNLDEALAATAPGLPAALDQQRQRALSQIPSVQESKANPQVMDAVRAMLTAQGVPAAQMDAAIDRALEEGHRTAVLLATGPNAAPTGTATPWSPTFLDGVGDRLTEHKQGLEQTVSNLLGLGSLTGSGAPGVAESWKDLATGVFDNPIADPKGYEQRHPDEPPLPRNAYEWGKGATDVGVFATTAGLGPEALAGRSGLTHEILDIPTPHVETPTPHTHVDGLPDGGYGDTHHSLVPQAETGWDYASDGGYSPHAPQLASDLNSAYAHDLPISDLARQVADHSTHHAPGVNSDRVVLGRWDGQDAGYIGEARHNGGGIYFDTGDPTWNAVGQGLGETQSKALGWQINEQFLRTQLENRVPRIEYVLPDGFTSVDEVARVRRETFSAMEIDYLNGNASKFGYKRVGNSWVY